MNTNNRVNTKDGYKEKIGKHWYYFIRTKCANCGITVFKSKKGLTSNHYKPFCGMPCKCEYEQKLKDPKGSSILNIKDTPNFYYLLGLLATDGHIDYPREDSHATNSSCVIELNEVDSDLINSLRNFFGGYVYITFTKQKNKTPMLKWYLNNRKFIDFLRSIGFVHNKTHILNLNDWFVGLEDKNKWHFMRGVWDGDGTFTIDKNKNCRVSVITASSIFADMIFSFLADRGLAPFKHVRKNFKHNSTYSIIGLGKKKSRIDFIDMLYDNKQEEMYLMRKYLKALEIKIQGG